MKRCDECSLCRQACPTGAISTDRFLLRAERCITYHNEKKGDIHFPSWMDPSWHNSVIGCSRCQAVCPQNRECIKRFGVQEEFSEEETAMLLKGVSSERLSEKTLDKLDRVGLTEELGILPRNLRVFFKKP
jgi:epoxyqueuosine reductase